MKLLLHLAWMFILLSDGVPLLWFGLYEQPRHTISAISDCFRNRMSKGYHLGSWRPEVGWSEYHAAIHEIKRQIAAGNTYQVNYTFPMQTDFHGDPWTLFTDLVMAQDGGYGAYVDTGRHVVCSASPELFFHLDGDVLTSKPMKGTAVRGLTPKKMMRTQPGCSSQRRTGQKT